MGIKQSLKKVKATTEKPNDFFAPVFTVEKIREVLPLELFFIGDSEEVMPEIEVAINGVIEQTEKISNNKLVGLHGIHSSSLR